MEIKKARYIRVSSQSQNNARQLAKAYPNEKLYVDVVSGAVPFNEREKGKELLADTLIGTINEISVSSIDRLGRDAFDIQKILNKLTELNINVKVDNLGISSMIDGKPNPIFKMITDVLANVAQMEREALKERQREGIKIAIANGTYKGRVKGSKESEEQILIKYKSVVKELKNNPTLSLAKIAKLCNDTFNKGEIKLSPNTIRKVKLILEKNKKE